MVAVIAGDHRVFQRMHKPDCEKRMVVIRDPAEYDRWLQCCADAASFFRRWTGPLDAFPAPLATRRFSKIKPPPDVAVGGLAGELF